MEEWESDLKDQLLPDEEIITHIPNLEYSFNFVPDVKPDSNWPTGLSMRLILTNRRLIARFWNGRVRKLFYTSAIHNLTERKINGDQPTWPYQATLMVAGGLILTVQTDKVDKIQQEKLSFILNRAFIMFSTQRDDLDAIAAIVKSEQQRRSKQAADSENKK